MRSTKLRGVPVRVEIGPKDIEKSACAVARRDVPGKEGKQFGIPLAGAAAHIEKLLRDIQQALYDRAKKFRDERITTANTLDEFKALFPVEKDDEAGAEPLKFVYAHWDGTARDRGPRAEGVQGDDPLSCRSMGRRSRGRASSPASPPRAASCSPGRTDGTSLRYEPSPPER